MNAQELLEHAKTDLTDEEKTHLALGLIGDAGSEIEVALLLASAQTVEDMLDGRTGIRPAREGMNAIGEKLGLSRSS